MSHNINFPLSSWMYLLLSRYIWVCPWPWKQGTWCCYCSYRALAVPTQAQEAASPSDPCSHASNTATTFLYKLSVLSCSTQVAYTVNFSYHQLLITSPPFKVIFTVIYKPVTVNMVDVVLANLNTPMTRLLVYIIHEKHDKDRKGKHKKNSNWIFGGEKIQWLELGTNLTFILSVLPL